MRIRAEFLEKSLRCGDAVAWAWLRETKCLYVLHLAAKIAEQFASLLQPAKDLALDMEPLTRGMFTSSFWYRAILAAIAQLQYGFDEQTDLRQLKAENDKQEACGLVKIHFDPNVKGNELLECKLNRVACFIPCAWVQPILDSYATEQIEGRVKFIYPKGDDTMSLLAIPITDSKSTMLLPDMTKLYPACKEAFVSGVLSRKGAQCFSTNTTTRWSFHIPIIHNNLPRDVDLVPRRHLPSQRPVELLPHVQGDISLQALPHHVFLTSLNVDPEKLQLISIRDRLTISDMFFNEGARTLSRHELENIWETLHGVQDMGRIRLDSVQEGVNERWEEMISRVRQLPMGAGYPIVDPYLYLTHLTARDIQSGSDLFPVPSAASLAAAAPSMQKQMLSVALFPRVAKLALDHAPWLTESILQVDNKDILAMLNDEQLLSIRIQTMMDVMSANPLTT